MGDSAVRARARPICSHPSRVHRTRVSRPIYENRNARYFFSSTRTSRLPKHLLELSIVGPRLNSGRIAAASGCATSGRNWLQLRPLVAWPPAAAILPNSDRNSIGADLLGFTVHYVIVSFQMTMRRRATATAAMPTLCVGYGHA